MKYRTIMKLLSGGLFVFFIFPLFLFWLTYGSKLHHTQSGTMLVEGNLPPVLSARWTSNNKSTKIQIVQGSTTVGYTLPFVKVDTGPETRRVRVLLPDCRTQAEIEITLGKKRPTLKISPAPVLETKSQLKGEFIVGGRATRIACL